MNKKEAMLKNQNLWVQYQENIVNVHDAIKIGDKKLEKLFRKKRKSLEKRMKEIKPYL